MNFTWKKFRQTGFEPNGFTIIEGPQGQTWYSGSGESASWTAGYDLRNPATEVTFKSRLSDGRTSAGLKILIKLKLQVLIPPMEYAVPGTLRGRAGYPQYQVVGVPFAATVRAVDELWYPVTTVSNEQIAITSTDPFATLPASQALINGVAPFSSTFGTATPNQYIYTITASEATDPVKTANTSPPVEIRP